MQASILRRLEIPMWEVVFHVLQAGTQLVPARIHALHVVRARAQLFAARLHVLHVLQASTKVRKVRLPV